MSTRTTPNPAPPLRGMHPSFVALERARKRFQMAGIAILLALGGALCLLLSHMQEVAFSNGRVLDATPAWAWGVWIGYVVLVVVFCNIAFDRDDLAPPPSTMHGSAFADVDGDLRPIPPPEGTGSADRERPARVITPRRTA